MDAEVEEVVVPELDSVRLSPEQRTNIVIRLLDEVVIINAAENAHDLQLFYLDFAPQTLAGSFSGWQLLQDPQDLQHSSRES